MKSINAAIWAEVLKTRKSKVFWISLIFFAFIPTMMSLFFVLQKHPELIEKLGIIGTKANLMQFGEPNWTNYFSLLNQAIAAVGLIGYGFATSWLFGSEYTENTLKDILALPVSRSKIATAKIITSIGWSIMMSLVFLLCAIVIGFIIGISGSSMGNIIHNSFRFLAISGLTVLLIPPVSFFAVYSKGYFFPLGFIILTLIMANVAGVIGLGPYFPWSIPGILSSDASAEGMQLVPVSYLILIITSSAGLAGTLAWFRFADQK